MPVNGNTLAKYLVMVSQVVAWCTVSAMLLRRGLNQVNAVGDTVVTAQRPTPLYVNKTYDDDDDDDDDSGGGGAVAVSATVRDVDRTGHGGGNGSANMHRAAGQSTKSLDENGAPAVVAGIIMITVAVIMLIISPTIMLMKMIEKRNKRLLDAELESPPKYDDVVESAPRYSSLFVFNSNGEMALLSEGVRADKDNARKQLV